MSRTITASATTSRALIRSFNQSSSTSTAFRVAFQGYEACLI